MNIDRIARGMVDIEPSRDLEARIRARIREARPAQAGAWWIWRVAAPFTAAAAAIAIALVVVQGPESKVGMQESRGPAIVSNVAAQPSSALPAEAARAGTLAKRLPAEGAPAGAVAKAELSSEELAWMERRIPALESMNSLQVEHLQVDSIQPEPLSITPLTMTPVATDSGGIERRNDR